MLHMSVWDVPGIRCQISMFSFSFDGSQRKLSDLQRTKWRSGIPNMLWSCGRRSSDQPVTLDSCCLSVWFACQNRNYSFDEDHKDPRVGRRHGRPCQTTVSVPSPVWYDSLIYWSKDTWNESNVSAVWFGITDPHRSVGDKQNEHIIMPPDSCSKHTSSLFSRI